MSTVRQIIQAVLATQRQIDDQMSKLQAYNSQVDKVMQQVQAELSDSTQQYSREMLDQLQQTKKQIDDTMNNLQAAEDKLTQVRTI